MASRNTPICYSKHFLGSPRVGFSLQLISYKKFVSINSNVQTYINLSCNMCYISSLITMSFSVERSNR